MQPLHLPLQPLRGSAAPPCWVRAAPSRAGAAPPWTPRAGPRAARAPPHRWRPPRGRAAGGVGSLRRRPNVPLTCRYRSFAPEEAGADPPSASPPTARCRVPAAFSSRRLPAHLGRSRSLIADWNGPRMVHRGRDRASPPGPSASAGPGSPRPPSSSCASSNCRLFRLARQPLPVQDQDRPPALLRTRLCIADQPQRVAHRRQASGSSTRMRRCARSSSSRMQRQADRNGTSADDEVVAPAQRVHQRLPPCLARHRPACRPAAPASPAHAGGHPPAAPRARPAARRPVPASAAQLLSPRGGRHVEQEGRGAEMQVGVEQDGVAPGHDAEVPGEVDGHRAGAHAAAHAGDGQQPAAQRRLPGRRPALRQRVRNGAPRSSRVSGFARYSIAHRRRASPRDRSRGSWDRPPPARRHAARRRWRGRRAPAAARLRHPRRR